MDLELKITVTARDVDELIHLLRLELFAALRDLPVVRQRIEEADYGKVVQWVTSASPSTS